MINYGTSPCKTNTQLKQDCFFNNRLHADIPATNTASCWHQLIYTANNNTVCSCDLEFDPMTLTYELIINMKILKMCLPKTNFLGQRFQTCEQKTDRHTQTRLKTLPRRIRAWQQIFSFLHIENLYIRSANVIRRRDSFNEGFPFSFLSRISHQVAGGVISQNQGVS